MVHHYFSLGLRFAFVLFLLLFHFVVVDGWAANPYFQKFLQKDPLLMPFLP